MRVLREAGQTEQVLKQASKIAPWKYALAEILRRDGGAGYAWIAERVQMGEPISVWSSWLCRRRKNQQITG